MSLRQTEVCELAAKISAVALLIAALLYLVLLGMNIAVMPAAYVELEAWGTQVAAVFSGVIAAGLLVLDVLLLVALFDRSRMRWFVIADAVAVLLLIVGTVAFSQIVRDSVVGTNALPVCNAALAAPILIVALVATVLLVREQVGSVAAVFGIARKPEAAEELVAAVDAEEAGVADATEVAEETEVVEEAEDAEEPDVADDAGEPEAGDADEMSEDAEEATVVVDPEAAETAVVAEEAEEAEAGEAPAVAKRPNALETLKRILFGAPAPTKQELFDFPTSAQEVRPPRRRPKSMQTAGQRERTRRLRERHVRQVQRTRR